MALSIFGHNLGPVNCFTAFSFSFHNTIRLRNASLWFLGIKETIQSNDFFLISSHFMKWTTSPASALKYQVTDCRVVTLSFSAILRVHKRISSMIAPNWSFIVHPRRPVTTSFIFKFLGSFAKLYDHRSHCYYEFFQLINKNSLQFAFIPKINPTVNSRSY